MLWLYEKIPFIVCIILVTTGLMLPVGAIDGLGSGLSLLDPAAEPPSPAAALGDVQVRLSSLPLTFIPNQGQYDPAVKYVVTGPRSTLFFTSDEIVIAAVEGTGNESVSHIIWQTFPGASPNPMIAGTDPLAGTANFFIGNDPSQWQTGVLTYGAVEYHDLFPGIDLRYKGTEGTLKREFVVAPGADPAMIRLQYDGVDSIAVDETGSLVLTSGTSTMTESPLICYQEINGEFVLVGAAYRILSDHEVALTLEQFDPSYPLVIDPALVYSTYLGGSTDQYGHDIAVDSSGNAYVTGRTDSSDFPTSASAYNWTNAGSTDIFVTKLNPSGSALIYSTYLGGWLYDSSNGISVDSAGNVYLTGRTDSPDFPTTANAYNRTFGGSGGYGDVFVTKLNPSGSSLIFSTYLGGGHWDEAYDISVDTSGNAYVAGQTNSVDFPTTASGYNRTYGGTQDAFVTKLNAAGSSLMYSTYLGGWRMDHCHGIAVDSSGNSYVSGDTLSPDFPTTGGAYDQTYGGYVDVFVTKLNAAGSSLLYSTYLEGGTTSDYSTGIAVDSSGNAYVTGYTISSLFPTTAGAFNRTNAGGDDAFVTKLNPSGSALIYSTFLGGSDVDMSQTIAVDSNGYAYVTGRTESPDFPTTDGAYNRTIGGDLLLLDAFVTKLAPSGSSLMYSTFLGGDYWDEGKGIAIDKNGNVYVTGVTGSATFPTTPGAYDRTLSGEIWDVFVTKLSMETAPGAASKIGLYRPSTQMWYLDYDNSGASDFKVKWGDITDKVVAGDWDGDDRDEIGLYRPSTQMWYLDYDNNGLSNYKIKWGDLSDIPVAGDWDGDNMDEIGLYRPSTQMWYLDYDNNGLRNYKVRWGDLSDIPVAGDWVGDNMDEIGLYRPSTQMWYLDYDNNGLSDLKVKWGDIADIPVAGDWDGDNKDEIGLYRPSTQMWYLDYDNNGLSDYRVAWGDSTDKPVAGRWI
jgi:hypothetical protein